MANKTSRELAQEGEEMTELLLTQEQEVAAANGKELITAERLQEYHRVAQAQLKKVLNAGYVQLDPDQSLPETLIDELEYGDTTCHDFRWGVHCAQQDMLKDWIKVKKEKKAKGDDKN